MPGKQIFLSYSSDDRLRVREFVQALEARGWSVWWDRTDIPPGERFSRVINEAIREAKVMIVLWSARSIESDWVLDEADDGKNRGILVPVLVDDVEVPRGFRQLQHVRLVDWRGGLDDPDFQKLLEAVERLAPPDRENVEDMRRPPSVPTADVDAATELRARYPIVAPPAVNRPINLGFDGPVVGGFPDGWFNSFGHVTGVSISYQCSIVPRPEVNGACLLLQKQGAQEDEFGSVMQRCPAGLLAERTVRFLGELRSKGVVGWAGLWLRADGDEEGNLYFDNMHRRPIRGTTDWTVHHIDAQLATLTRWLNYGVVLAGDGQLWVDDCRLLMWDDAGTWREW
jgi:hypothetical protein